jgi:hypothetical protein
MEKKQAYPMVLQSLFTYNTSGSRRRVVAAPI